LARGRGDAVALDALDRVYLRRCYELAERGRGGTSPNPCVGAVLVRDARTLGEGFHRRKGAPHAEVEALHAAAVADLDARGATAYVSLEPCNHHGATPPCSEALIAAGVSRVVAGCLDPNPRTAGGGVERLRGAGIVVDVVGAPEAEALVEEFAVAVTTGRPYLRLKMATSLDGFVSPERGRRHQLTGPAAGAFVRDLRGAYDAVLVGAETVRVDDPRLTVRPARSRHLPYRRIVLCGAEPVDPASNVFVPVDGYAPTIVLAAESRSAAFGSLERVAEVVSVPGDSPGGKLDLGFALAALRARGIASILCEGGPTLAGGLLEAGLVDRLDWLTAPLFLGGPEAVPVLNRANPRTRFRFDRVERLGEDLLQSGRPERK
jgi:diaminohydroxyphosphoribosylaminopyrimidine deaminase/5-amino-6-(5-phosphoribosylamino)uracil reductase